MIDNIATLDTQITDLDKAAESVKQDRVIVQDLAQAIVMGTVPIEVSFWTSWPGFLLLLVMGLLLAAAVVIAYTHNETTQTCSSSGTTSADHNNEITDNT